MDEGYTQIKNWLLAKMYHDDTLTGRELRVLLYLIRKLPGFHKASDKIPYSQIAEGTGIDRSNVIKVVQSLENKGWIIVKRKEKCINIIRFKGSVMGNTRASVKKHTIEVSSTTPSKENQKKTTSGLAPDEPTLVVKENIEREIEEDEYGYE